MLHGGLKRYSLMAGLNASWVQQYKVLGLLFNLAFISESLMTFFVAMTGVYMSYIKGFQVYLLLPYARTLILIILLYFKSKPTSNRILNLFVYTIIIQLSFALTMVLKNGHVLSLTPYYNIFTIPYVFILIAYISNEILKKKVYLCRDFILFNFCNL